MGRFAGRVLVVLVMGCGVACARGRHEKWSAVMSLAAGVPIELELTRGRPEECDVVAVDASTLTCERERDPDANWGPGDGARVIVPRDSVRAVWVWERMREPHIGLWIAAGVGFALGGLVCAPAGPGAIVACGALGALFAVTIVASAGEAGPVPYPGVWFPAPPPPSYSARQPRWHRKLWYRAPAPVSSGAAQAGSVAP